MSSLPDIVGKGIMILGYPVCLSVHSFFICLFICLFVLLSVCPVRYCYYNIS